MMKKKSPYAEAAFRIRKELKKHGIKARVRSASFSMGDSVSITLYDPLPATHKMVDEFSGRYEKGHFNGMEDIYEYRKDYDEDANTKYVIIEIEYSDEMKEKALKYVHDKFNMDGMTERDYVEFMYRELRSEKSGFWYHIKPRLAA